MRCLCFVVIGVVVLSGCLDFLDESVDNNKPLASANVVGGTTFEPNQEIVFNAKGSSDPDGDVLEYFWDFDKNDGISESIVGNIAKHGETKHTYEMEGAFTVTLTVSDGKDTAVDTIKIVIEKSQSEIKAVVETSEETKTVMKNNEKVEFSFSASKSTSESSITKYEWDFSYETSEGFNVDEETNEDETNWEFDSGIYTVKVRITNSEGEVDEGTLQEKIRINYENTETKTIDTGDHEFETQVYGLPARYIRATLEYEAGAFHTSDLDLYLYNQTQERNPDEDESSGSENECNVCVARNVSHDETQSKQTNIIELDYYNSTQRAWFDEEEELGKWFFLVDHERGSPDYTIKIEVIYWEEQ